MDYDDRSDRVSERGNVTLLGINGTLHNHQESKTEDNHENVSFKWERDGFPTIWVKKTPFRILIVSVLAATKSGRTDAGECKVVVGTHPPLNVFNKEWVILSPLLDPKKESATKNVYDVRVHGIPVERPVPIRLTSSAPMSRSGCSTSIATTSSHGTV